MRGQWILVWIVGACLVAGCSRQETGWREAKGKDSVPAYESYLERFPAGAHAVEARARISMLREEREWARAGQLATPEAYQRYLGAYPEGRHAAAARDRLSDFVLARAPPPDPAERSYTVQLGAYSNEATARSLFARLSRDHADLLDGLDFRVLPPVAGTPGLWRLRTHSLGEAAARSLCAKFEARGVDCIPGAE